MQRNRGLIAAALMAAAAGASSVSTAAVPRMPATPRGQYLAGFKVFGGQPYRGTAGMANGTKTRGNRSVQRAAQKRRNQQRHRKACRG